MSTLNLAIYMFGGEPFAKERLIDRNIVALRKELIDQAIQKWITQSFDKIIGDETEFIPYPSRIINNHGKSYSQPWQ